MTLYDEGAFPSITELAAHAQVSRATAYRYFPTQSALISAVVAESLGPILEWRPQDDDALKRIQQLLTFAYPQMERHEGALRAALQLSLQQWAHATPGEKFVRGNRKRLLALAVEPLQGKLPPDSLQRVIHAFSLIYGSEVFLVLKDIWGWSLRAFRTSRNGWPKPFCVRRKRTRRTAKKHQQDNPIFADGRVKNQHNSLSEYWQNL
ncbi:bacterial regulatory, tetR family protein [Serratia marcescens]|nr:bacterial regulatory, tetR family protein [Serratia marcescens]